MLSHVHSRRRAVSRCDRCMLELGDDPLDWIGPVEDAGHIVVLGGYGPELDVCAAARWRRPCDPSSRTVVSGLRPVAPIW